MYSRKFNFSVQKQSGVALFISLIMLFALTIIGLSAANRSNLQERMAGNLHLQNLAFNGSESAIGGFVSESFVGNNADPAHVLYSLRTTGVLNDQCYNSAGVRSDCGGIYIDSDRAGAITAEVDVAVIDDCNPSACGGFTIGDGASGGVGCRVFKIDGTGSVGTKTETSSLWAYELTACSN